MIVNSKEIAEIIQSENKETSLDSPSTQRDIPNSQFKSSKCKLIN